MRQYQGPVLRIELGQKDPDPVWRALEFLWAIYGSLNSWYSADRLMAAAPIQWAPGMIERALTIVAIPEEIIENLLARQGGELG